MRSWLKCDTVAATPSSPPTHPSTRPAHYSHRRVYDTPWPPFAIPYDAAPKGWSGIDADLLERLADMLGFTYNITTFHKEGNETWSQALFRVADEADLVASYWIRSQARLERVAQVAGHVDLASVVVARQTIARPTMWDRATSIFRPFSPGLWIGLITMTVSAGFVDYLLEHRQGGRLGASIYEYLAGMLWGGFEYPRSRSSAVFQVTMGFIVIVTIAIYTAEIAAFLTVTAAPVLSASSADDVMARDLTMCSYSNPQLVAYDTLYPRLRIVEYTDSAEVVEKLMSNSGCDAAILSRVDYEISKMGRDACDMHIAQTVFPDQGGWMTKKENGCVQQSIGWALKGLQMTGELQDILRTWLPVYPSCSTSSVELNQDELAGARRRLLHSHETGGVPGRHTGRRLQEQPSISDEQQEVGVADLVDFLGVFMLFGIVSAGLLSGHAISYAMDTYIWLKTTKNFIYKRLGIKINRAAALRKSMRTNRLDALLLNAGVHRDDEAGMLHEVLLQLDDLKQKLTTGSQSARLSSGRLSAGCQGTYGSGSSHRGFRQPTRKTTTPSISSIPDV